MDLIVFVLHYWLENVKSSSSGWSGQDTSQHAGNPPELRLPLESSGDPAKTGSVSWFQTWILMEEAGLWSW